MATDTADGPYAPPTAYGAPVYAPEPAAEVLLGGGRVYDDHRGYDDRRGYDNRRFDDRRGQAERVADERHDRARQAPARPAPAPAAPPQAARGNVPPPPAGGPAFEQWQHTYVNGAPGNATR